MGQKVNPISLRIGITRNWNSNWFVANKIKYKDFLHEDLKVRGYVKKKFFQAGISKLEIERSSEEKMRLVVYCSKPGLLIGRKGIDIESLRKDLNKMVNKDVYIDIREVKRPEIDSQLVDEAIKKYHNPTVKKYSGGHFFSTGIEREVAQEFIDSMKNKIPSPIERHIN